MVHLKKIFPILIILSLIYLIWEKGQEYIPIRITIDELRDRTNEGIMYMNDKIEDVIVVNSMVKDGKPAQKDDAKEE